MSFAVLSAVLALSFAFTANAESHTVRFVNNCGQGTPQLVQAGNILSNGEDYTSNGPLDSAIAYLQTGKCLLNGEFCSLVELNLNNPTCAGCGSSSDISLIPTHEFNVGVAFEYFGGDGNECDGLGAVCTTKTCNTAFFVPTDTSVQRACQKDNANLLITFCPSGATRFTAAAPGSLANQASGGSGSPAPKSSSVTAAPASTSKPVAPASSALAAKSSSPASVPVNVGAATSVASSPASTAAAPSNTKTCSRRKLTRSRRSPSPESKRAHKRSQAIARGFSHKKF